MIFVPVYRPHQHQLMSLWIMLEFIAQFQYVPKCIVGDFHEDVSITSNTHSCALLRLQTFQQMASKLTHDSGTIIDHVYLT